MSCDEKGLLGRSVPNTSAATGVKSAFATLGHSARSAAVSSIYKRPPTEPLSPPSSPKQRKLGTVRSRDRADLLSRKLILLRSLKKKNIAHVSEQYYLQFYNGNVLDYHTFTEHTKKSLDSHVAAHSVSQQIRDLECEILKHVGRNGNQKSPSPLHRTKIQQTVKETATKISSCPAPAPSSEKVVTPKDSPTQKQVLASPARPKSPRHSVANGPSGNTVTLKSPGTPRGQHSTKSPSSRSSLTGSPIEGSIERAAKQEAAVLNRIAELQKQGLWSQKQLPRCADPIRAKTHWDFMLEEMHWMSIDFSQERRWKRAAARKLAKDIARQDREQKEKETKIEKEKERDLKRIASSIAREIRGFWKGVEKVVDYKSQCILEAKKQKALDRHLDYIVGQTEKFSSWVQEGLTTKPETPSTSGSKTPSLASKYDDTEDYADGSDMEMDDERTIEKEERIMGKEEVEDELSKLKNESVQDLDDVFSHLPQGYIEHLRNLTLGKQYRDEIENSNSEKGSSDSESEDEKSITSVRSAEKGEDAVESSSRESSRPQSQLSSQTQQNEDVAEKNLDDIAEVAEKFLPKGYTLDTTQVVTKIPHLLRHTLREYQHVGLDWLVALYDKDLNGILADEMGLGKTIQTIALLAHLACEKNNWGPHLIVVPTSVMLNWEMEFKKWCPGFKILTYYGSQKERKEKRKGWSKPNTFHVCITSYKLVIQDFRSFRQKAWEYFILDEAQHIKNFKSQRWQMLLGFNSRRRLLLTGTPLQNNLMELWSLMHFLMPRVFGSHRDFKDWFNNPLMGMIEGTQEFDAQKVQRLHKVLRPFILRRLKSEVEKQLPRKYEHVVRCLLSKRQRYLYDDYMSRGTTREQISGGNVMSVLNTLMQLRKVCNHPNLFEPRPIRSPFALPSLEYRVPSVFCDIVKWDPVEHVRIPDILKLNMDETRRRLKRSKSLMINRKMIVETATSRERNGCPSLPKVAGFKFSCAKPIKRVIGGPENVMAPLKTEIRPAFVLRADVATLRNYIIEIPCGSNSTKTVPFSLETKQQDGVKAHVPVSFKQATADHPSPTLGSRSPALLTLQPSSGAGVIPLAVPHSRANPTAAVDVRTSINSNFSVAAPWSENGGVAVTESSFEPLVQTPENTSVGAVANRTPRIIQLVSKPKWNNSYNPGPGWHPIQRYIAPGTTPRIASAKPSIVSSYAGGSSSCRPVITVQEIPPKEPRKEIMIHPIGAGASSPGVTSWRPLMRSLHLETSAGSNMTPVSTSSGCSSRSSPSMVPSELTPNLPSPAACEPPASKRQKIDAGTSTIFHQGSISKHRSSEYPELNLKSVGTRMSEWRRKSLARLGVENERRCGFGRLPVFGEDALGILSEATNFECHFLDVPATTLAIWLKETVNKFALTVPTVHCRSPRLMVKGGKRCQFWEEEEEGNLLRVVKRFNLSGFEHQLTVNRSFLFPERRLIEYDCGKLQALAELLRELKQGGHKCLIFTQMSKMLDVLEAFLSYHGYKYLRLDGATKIEHRQILMERFNMDRKIFCFILSTRSGGLGVNLTGADTVIFYDSDWNPTMDAQAQDRCHRIGQTRDVHIYRLISEKTVEENILKKASQKRKLGEIAIEEGSFTAEFLKKSNLRDLFDLPASDEKSDSLDDSSLLTEQELEQAMLSVEDSQDAVAANIVRAEVVNEFKEFDDSQISAPRVTESFEEEDPEIARVQAEMAELMEQLTPVERYAVRYLDRVFRPDLEEEIRLTEEEIEQKKRDWEAEYQRSLEEEALKREQEEDEDDLALSYFVEDGMDQVRNTGVSAKRLSGGGLKSAASTSVAKEVVNGSNSVPSDSCRRSIRPLRFVTTGKKQEEKDGPDGGEVNESGSIRTDSSFNSDEGDSSITVPRAKKTMSKLASFSPTANVSDAETASSSWTSTPVRRVRFCMDQKVGTERKRPGGLGEYERPKPCLPSLKSHRRNNLAVNSRSENYVESNIFDLLNKNSSN